LFASLELVNQLIHEHEENESVFNFLETFIKWLSDYEAINPSIFCYVQLRCAELIGFNLAVESDDTLEESYFDVTHGVITHRFQSELSYKLTVIQTQFLKQALSSRSNKVFQLGLAGGELKQLIQHLDVYFKYHIEGYQDRKSDSIFDQMLKDYQ
jgi:recombinational DNA repair protein (RecF pathway)